MATSEPLGLDRLATAITTDPGLAANATAADVTAGANAATALNRLLLEGIDAVGALADNRIDTADLEALNGWLRGDASRLAEYRSLYGTDVPGQAETGFQRVVDARAETRLFGDNLVNDVALSIYQFGQPIRSGRFDTADGATLAATAARLDALLVDFATTNSSLDSLTEALVQEPTLRDRIDAGVFATGLRAADGLAALLLEALAATGVGADGFVLNEEAPALAAWVFANGARKAEFDTLYGDLAPLLGGPGDTTLFGTGVAVVAEQLYAFGRGSAAVDTVALWTNALVYGAAPGRGTEAADRLDGGDGIDQLLGANGNDVLRARGGADLVRGEAGDDQLLGGAGADLLIGGVGTDTLRGGAGADIYWATGTFAADWQGYDRYLDGGADGIDVVRAEGALVEIGLAGFARQNGIERIEAAAGGTVRLLDDEVGRLLDFTTTELRGVTLIDAGRGEDTIRGSAAADTIRGGDGDDLLDGGGGGDVYLARGIFRPGATWEGNDTYRDTGNSGVDVIVVTGGDVDVGIDGFGPQSGIERIDTTGATGLVRLLDSKAGNVIDVSTLQVIGTLKVDGEDGNDTIIGSDGADLLEGMGQSDSIIGGGGDDTIISGWDPDIVVLTRNGGDDRLEGFRPGIDRLDVDEVGVNSLSLRDVAAGVLVTHAGGSVLIADITLDTFTFDQLIA